MTTELERTYWDAAALDPDVDAKYISDTPADYFREVLNDMPGEVLDLGCGIGRLLAPGWSGCDISANMLEIALKKWPNNDLRICDGRAIPFHDNKFDYVFSVLMFQHIPLEAKAGYINEVYRVLKPGGRFICQFVVGDYEALFHHNMSLERMTSFLESAGFKDVGIRTDVYRSQWAWIRGDK